MARRTRKPSAAAPVAPPAADFGRTVRRKAASYAGTLLNYSVRLVNARIAEREKRTSSDRALDLYVNSAIAHGLIEGLLAEVVGTGLTPQPSPMVRWLGLDNAWRQEWTSACFDWFEIIGLDPRNWSDAQRRCDFYALQALAFFNWRLEGLAVFQVVERKDSRSPTSICLNPIAPCRVVTPTDKAGANVFDGIEVDDFGAPVAVWVAKPAAYGAPRNAFDSAAMTRLPVRHEKTGLPKVLLVADVRNIADYRQDGILSCITKEIKDGEDFREAALIRALIANLFTVFIENGQPPGGSMGANPSGAAVTDWNQRYQELERGLILEGAAGQKPTVIDNDAPGPNYEGMVADVHRAIGIATGRGRENVTREYVASYSAAQASLENSERFSENDRRVLSRTFSQPWWMWQVIEGVGRGVLPAPLSVDLLGDLYPLSRCTWMRPPVRHIDKQKIAQADDVRLANNTATLSDVWAEKGQDWRAALEQRYEERAFEKELAERHGLPVAGPVTQKPAADPGEEDEDGRRDD